MGAKIDLILHGQGKKIGNVQETKYNNLSIRENICNWII